MENPPLAWFTIDFSFFFFPNPYKTQKSDFNIMFVPLSHLMKIRRRGTYCHLVQENTLIGSCARLELHSSIFFKLQTSFAKFNNDFFLDQMGTALEFDSIPSNFSFSFPHDTDLYHYLFFYLLFFFNAFFNSLVILSFNQFLQAFPWDI